MAAGRDSVEANLADSLKSRNHSLQDFFSVKSFLLEEKKSKSSNKNGEGAATSSTVEKIGVRFWHEQAAFQSVCIWAFDWQ